MRTGALRCFATVLALGLLTACGADDDGLTAYHDCEENLLKSDGWDERLLEIEHVEPSLCPVNLTAPGEEIRTGGDIYDYGTWDAARAYLDVYSSAWNLMASEREDFFQPQGETYHFVFQSSPISMQERARIPSAMATTIMLFSNWRPLTTPIPTQE